MNPYVHELTLERRLFDDSPAARDDYGQPAQTTSTSTVKGLVQPRTAKEADDHRSAGASLVDHVIFLPISTVVDGARALIWDGRRYEVTGMRPVRYGRLQHWEIDARLITAQAVAGDGEGS